MNFEVIVENKRYQVVQLYFEESGELNSITYKADGEYKYIYKADGVPLEDLLLGAYKAQHDIIDKMLQDVHERLSTANKELAGRALEFSEVFTKGSNNFYKEIENYKEAKVHASKLADLAIELELLIEKYLPCKGVE